MEKITISNPSTAVQSNPVVAHEPSVVQEATPIAEPIVTEPVVTTPQEPIVNNTEPVSAAQEPTVSSNETTEVTKISFAPIEPSAPIVGEHEAQPEQPKVTMEDVLKTIPKEKLYEYLGFDEHTVKFNELRKQGANPYDLIQQKYVDWDKISDDQLVKMDMQKKYPHLTADKIELLYAQQYKQRDIDADEDREFGNILKEAEAGTIRAREKEAQKKNEIPTYTPPQQPNEYENKYKSLVQQEEQLKQVIVNDTNVKSFLAEKKLKIDVGNGKVHTFEIENPQHLVDVLIDGNVSSKYGRNAQGQPDTQFLLQRALFHVAPQQYNEALINYGKSIALLDELLKDGQNVSKPIGSAPTPTGGSVNSNKKITAANNRISTFGGQ